MLIIDKIEKNGIAKEYGFEKGDGILAFNGNECVDILDYLYYDSESVFSVSVLSKTGEKVEVQIEKEYDESLGLKFVSDNLDIKTCRNKCVFCFVDQMPPNMRKSLYVKDDDYRQSFLCGNFVTLTNVDDKDMERILRLNLSPLYVSVQAVDKKVREKLLNNRFAGDILDKLKTLTGGGIKVDTQIVLVPKLNDGAVLENSLSELYKLRPNLNSVAIVPCGITKFRNGLYPIEDITPGYAKCVIEEVRAFNRKVGENFAILGDEFYFKANIPLEEKDFYGDFSQIGNGVGTTAKFESEVLESIKPKKHKGKFLIISGTSAGEFIKNLSEKVAKSVQGIVVKTVAVKNEFFGETVNCTGLLTGGDIYNAIKNEIENYDFVVLPDVCLKQDEDIFLDDMTVKELRAKINKKIIITDGSGQSFFDALSGGKKVRIIK